jgi:ribosome-associated protein
MQPAIREYYNLEELWQTTPAQRRKAAEQAAAK